MKKRKIRGDSNQVAFAVVAALTQQEQPARRATRPAPPKTKTCNGFLRDSRHAGSRALRVALDQTGDDADPRLCA